MPKQSAAYAILLLIPIVVGVCTCGCKSASVSEVRGKNQFGPEFQNQGNNTHQVRYYLGQGVELKWENGWTTAATYRYRPVDEGNGNQEHLVLFEVGYPIWKAPKKQDKTAMQIEELQNQIGKLQSQLVGTNSQAGRSSSLAIVDETENGHFSEKEKSDAQQ